MMKKWFCMTLLAVVLVGAMKMPSLRAYSPDYLPGGKNYLSPDNFQYDSGYLSTIDPFLVKPYTQYTLALPRWYAENAGGSDVSFTFFCDEEELDTLVFDPFEDFTDAGGTSFWFLVLQTPADVNFVALSLEDGRDPLSVGAVSEMQFEEGTAFTGWEAYVPGVMTDVNGPYFEGNPVIISNVDDPLTLAEIQSGIQAYDAIDGDVTEDILVVNDGYTGNGAILGNYTIVFRVSDTCSNVTEFTMTVKVVDVNPPLISGPGTIVVPHPQTKTLAQLMGELSASDQHEGDLTHTLNVVSDEYTAQAGIVGEYEVTFEARDSSDNVGSYTLVVSVVDDASPIFSGVSEVTIGYDQRLSVEDVQSMMEAVDGYDGDVTAEIDLVSDGFSAHLHEVGQYLLVFAVEDANGNRAEKTVCVRVVDRIGPIIYFDTSIIRVYNTTVLTLTDFTTLLVHADELDDNTDYAVEVRFDSYSAHASVPGTYHLALDYHRPDGSVLTKSLQIVVREKPVDYIDGIPVDPPREPTFLDQNRSWIVGSTFLLSLVLTNLIYVLVRRKVH